MNFTLKYYEFTKATHKEIHTENEAYSRGLVLRIKQSLTKSQRKIINDLNR